MRSARPRAHARPQPHRYGYGERTPADFLYATIALAAITITVGGFALLCVRIATYH